MKVKVYAKLNLTLNVLGAQNGFHSIDSTVASVDIFDVVQVTPRADKRVIVSGLQYVAAEQNTAYKAACAFMERFSALNYKSSAVLGADITIDKGIPIGAGMGGSSADAAAVVYALCKLCNVDIDDPRIRALCAEIGSDVSFMLHGGLGRLRGKGDDVELFEMNSPLYFALTTFDTSMSTAEVYSQFDKLNNVQPHVDNGALIDALHRGRACEAVSRFNNHLQAAAARLSNYACGYLRFCSSNSLVSNMTGSGSAYYVAFDNEQSAHNACALLNANGFTTVVCKTVPCGIEII